LNQASAAIGSAFGGLFSSVLQSTIQPLVNGAIFTTFVLYYIIPLVYVMGLLISFMMCAESTENWVLSDPMRKIQTRNIIGFIFCLKMCRADAADAISSDGAGNTVVVPADAE
jgi:ACR3 family arsenite efflux pump ArsB